MTPFLTDLIRFSEIAGIAQRLQVLEHGGTAPAPRLNMIDMEFQPADDPVPDR